MKSSVTSIYLPWIDCLTKILSTSALVGTVTAIDRLSPMVNLEPSYLTYTLLLPVSIDTIVALIVLVSIISPTFKLPTVLRIKESKRDVYGSESLTAWWILWILDTSGNFRDISLSCTLVP